MQQVQNQHGAQNPGNNCLPRSTLPGKRKLEVMCYHPDIQAWQNPRNAGRIAKTWDWELAMELPLRSGVLFRREDCLLLFHHFKKYRCSQLELACRKRLQSRYKLLVSGDRVSMFSVTAQSHRKHWLIEYYSRKKRTGYGVHKTFKEE